MSARYLLNRICASSASISPNFAGGLFLLYKAKLRLLVVRDIFHGEWNDAILALKDAGLWSKVTLAPVALNLPYGPGMGQLGGRSRS